MTIEKALRGRLQELRDRGQSLRHTGQYGVAKGEQHAAQCAAWLAATRHAVESADGGATSYSDTARRVASERHGAGIPNAVGQLTDMLEYFLADVDAGLLVHSPTRPGPRRSTTSSTTGRRTSETKGRGKRG